MDPDSADPQRKSGAQVGDAAFVLGVLTTNHVRNKVNLEVKYSGRGGLATLTVYVILVGVISVKP